MEVPSEVMMALIAGIGAFVGRMWFAVTGELKDCKRDRLDLYKQVGELNKATAEMSKTLGRMEAHLEFNDRRHDDHAAGHPGTTKSPE